MPIPTKKTIKEKYNLLNEDFEIRTQVPSEEEIRGKDLLVEAISWISGIPTLLFKTRWGKVVLVCVLPGIMANGFKSGEQKIAEVLGVISTTADYYSGVIGQMEMPKFPEHYIQIAIAANGMNALPSNTNSVSHSIGFAAGTTAGITAGTSIDRI
jgi:hypothetical protein